MKQSQGYVATPDGVRLCFQKLGSGPTVVVIPNSVHMFHSFERVAEQHTVIFFDLRNRGGSDVVHDASKLAKGIHHDVDDIEAVRRHFGIEKIHLIGHSYLGLVVILYALKYPEHVCRVVQIGPVQPNAATQYPAHLTGADATLKAFGAKVAAMRSAGPPADPKQACQDFWELLKALMVANPADTGKINWTICDYPNEVGLMPHWIKNLQPSIESVRLSPAEVARVRLPVLTIHGMRDRQAPYGGGREWACMLPNARLVTVENAAHVPWIEDPEKVFGSIETFLAGTWPEAAQQVTVIDPRASA